MQTPDPDPNDRLDSWKAISAYLKRDERTLRRWERELGLPIRRVAGGTNSSVFAYQAEIDAWLRRKEAAESPLAPSARAVPQAAGRRRLATFAAIAVTIVLGVVWRSWSSDVSIADLRLDVTATGVAAYDRRGAERWRHDFPSDRTTAIPGLEQAWAVMAGTRPQVLAATAASTRRDGAIDGGALMAFSATGELLQTFTFDDEVAFADAAFTRPWGLTAFAVESAPPHRIAVAGHHYVWWPGIVTVLDAEWHRRGTFIHPGWIETVRWLSPTSLLIGGYSNARDGGMLAILHPDELEGQAPEEPRTQYYCETCGSKRPVRMITLPRTEVNRAAGAPFNRAVIQVSKSRVTARTVEVASEQGPADAIYEFTLGLDLIAATFSERYWDMHRALEVQGKLAHTAAACPERAGPNVVETWDRLHGWQRQTVQRP